MNRRHFLTQSTGTIVGGALPHNFQARNFRGSSRKHIQPNILVILVDDLGYGDLSAYGAPDLLTPHIDRIVSEGMRFDRFYANCPVCSPTRASLLTGRYPHRVGVPGVIRTHAENSWGYLDPNCITLQETLQASGYTTSLIGKWHLGLESPNKPNQRGFDYFCGFLGDMMDDYFTHRRHGINYMRRDEREIDPQGHATDLFTDWACEYIRKQENSSQPFFLYLAYNAPHSPIQPREDWLKRIQKREPGLDPQRAKFGALAEHLDDGIGKVMTALKETGLDGDTLVVFSSDNGGKLNYGASNYPLRGEKGTLYEGGIRVPTAFRWPGRIPAGTHSSRVALTMDITPTVLDAANVRIRSEIDGSGIWPTIQGFEQSEFNRDLFFIRREGGAFKSKTIEAIRRGEWKILTPMPGEPFKLFNLCTDPREYMNKRTIETQKYAELEERLQQEIATYDDVPWQPPERWKK